MSAKARDRHTNNKNMKGGSMSLVRWADPFSMMRWPASAFDDVDFDALSTSVASNNLDVFETENEIIVRANVAGIPESKVDITYEKGVLWIRAMEEEEKKEGRKYYQRAKRSYSYKIAVPGNVDVKKDPKAEIADGIVTVTFQKAEEEKPKKVSVTRK